jgi:predicted  nucleic acid-binding Zn-ribbon protein
MRPATAFLALSFLTLSACGCSSVTYYKEYRETKAQLDQLKRQYRAMEAEKEHWQNEARQWRHEAEKLKEESEGLQEQLVRYKSAFRRIIYED